MCSIYSVHPSQQTQAEMSAPVSSTHIFQMCSLKFCIISLVLMFI